MEKIHLQSQLLPRLNETKTLNKGLAEEFGAALGHAIKEVNKTQVKADQGIEKLQSGQDATIPEVMINMEQADISMRLLVQMRNKVIEAYQEIMRMQV